MRTEARQSFYHGFILTEQELRRIIDTATQQLQKVSPDKQEIFIEVKFRNGTISQIPSIDDLLAIENVGSTQITRLHIHLSHTAQDDQKQGEDNDNDDHVPNHLIGLTFRNPEQDDDPRSISYWVRGLDRDWVLVTASEIEERITKIKSQSPRGFFPPRRRSRLLPELPISLSSLLVMAAFVSFTLAINQASKTPPNAALQSLEERWKAGTIHDPIEAMIMLEKESELRRAHLDINNHFLKTTATTSAATMAFVALTMLAFYLYPAYVFCWGDNTKLYQRRVQIRNFILGAVLLTLLLGVIAGIIANRITIHH